MATSQKVARLAHENLEYVGAALAYLVAGIHLFHPQRGFPRLVAFLATGNASLLAHDPRPLAFVVSGLAIIVGIKLVLFDVARKRVYALGIAFVAVHLVGYFAWHLSGHGGFLPGREPLYHGVHPFEAVVAHLADYPLARVSKIAEALLLLVLAALYRRESRSDADDGFVHPTANDE